jgi:hypothetical protein
MALRQLAAQGERCFIAILKRCIGSQTEVKIIEALEAPGPSDHC